MSRSRSRLVEQQIAKALIAEFELRYNIAVEARRAFLKP